MNTIARKALCLGCIGLIAFVFGCGPRKRDRKGQPLPAEGAKGVPEWVTNGAAAFSDSKKGQVFYAVGAMAGVKNFSLLRRASEDKARVEMANAFDTFVRTLAKSYARSVGTFDASQEEQLVQDTTKAYTDVTLKGVQIWDHYFDKLTQTMYSLARLDLKVFKDAIQKAESLSAEYREYLKSNADTAFQDVEKEKSR
jgi:hypothetical protein